LSPKATEGRDHHFILRELPNWKPVNTIEHEMSSPRPPARVIYTADSRLHRIRSFLGTARRDLRGSWPTTTRFFRRSLAQRYRYSSLGLIWAFLPSVITALVLIAGQRTRLIGHGQVPPPFYGVFGLTLGMSFLEALNTLRSIFTTHQFLLRRNNVPIEGLISAAIIEMGFNSAIRVVVLAAAFIFFGVPPILTLPLALLGFIGTVLLGCGIGLLLAPFSSLKRDLDNIMSFLPWIVFAVTPIFVRANSHALETIYRFNPLAWIFDSTRTLAYGAPGSAWPAILSPVFGLGLMLLGWLLCRLWRPYVVERSLV
jgi:lipopolysaccharide transport system permease protein